MKRAMLLSLATASALFAGTVNINTGWNLVGAVDDVSPSAIGCASTVWTYDAMMGWSLFQTMNQTDNYGYNPLTYINKGQGFWVNADCASTIDFTDSTGTTTGSSLEMTTATANTLQFGDFTVAYNTDYGDNWYGVFNIDLASSTISVSDYEKNDDGTWYHDNTFNASYVPNATTGGITISEYEGSTLMFSGEAVINNTQQITAMNGISYTDLYISDLEITVVTSTFEDEDWDWGPRYWDSTNTAITNTYDFFQEALTNDQYYFGDNDYAMLSGTGTSGDVVEGTVTEYACDTDNDGYANETCKNVTKSTNVIGSWFYTDTSGIYIETSNEEKYITIVSSNNTDTGYTVHERSKDKVGAVWNEKLFTGSDANSALVQDYVNNK